MGVDCKHDDMTNKIPKKTQPNKVKTISHIRLPNKTAESPDIIAERGYNLKDEIEKNIIFLRLSVAMGVRTAPEV
jgi:hypothetical protein